MNILEKIICKCCPEITKKRWEEVQIYNRETTEELFSRTNEILNNQYKIRKELHNEFLVTQKVREEVHTNHIEARKLEESVSQLRKFNTYQKEKINQIMIWLQENKSTTDEICWAEIFNSTICQSEWLKRRELSPGRWAAGYQLLYVLYRTLDEFRPQKILELGLGETTKLISQYAAEFQDQVKEHTVIEHDQHWIDSFKKRFEIGTNTNIVQCALENSVFKNDEVLSYKDFKHAIKNTRYNLIVIDGPFGGQAKKYSRVDVIRVLPDCLDKEFVIIMDDTNRKPEENTFNEMINVLQQCGIRYCWSRQYRGSKYSYIITSENLNFLCTM